MASITCVPMKELKNTAEFTAKVQAASGPVIVTKNGSEAFVSMSMDCYEALAENAARAELYRSIDRAEADIAAGRVYDAFDMVAEAKAAYGL